MKEIWIDVPEHPKYQVSNIGRVRSKKNGLMRQYSQREPYKFVEFHDSGRKKIHKVHRLVAMAFIPNPNDYELVMHLDNDPTNNRVDNLQWGTKKMNAQQMVRDNRNFKLIGEDHPESKLTAEQVLEIRNKYVPRKYTLHMLAEEYGVSFGLIHHIIKNRNWTHV